MRSVHTWLKLQEPITLDFAKETPFEDALKFIKLKAQGKDGKPLTLYVDPVGLQEAEKTMTSPVQVELADVSVDTALKLILKQLGLMHYIQKDGVVVITSASTEETVTEVFPLLTRLRTSAARWRGEGRAASRFLHDGGRRSPPAVPGMGGMGGGFR